MSYRHDHVRDDYRCADCSDREEAAAKEKGASECHEKHPTHIGRTNIIRNGDASRIRHLIDRVRATMVALEAGLSTGTPLGHDTPQTLALVAVELSRYVSIYDEEVKKR